MTHFSDFFFSVLMFLYVLSLYAYYFVLYIGRVHIVYVMVFNHCQWCLSNLLKKRLKILFKSYFLLFSCCCVFCFITVFNRLFWRPLVVRPIDYNINVHAHLIRLKLWWWCSVLSCLLGSFQHPCWKRENGMMIQSGFKGQSTYDFIFILLLI